ncbi:MAG: tetratricopeptide repeat protein, partial [Gammaproteobacteria bacterium]|nr:tetratricopeptide repeat protein [Gammaproteobacteria bacterium]
MQKIKLSLYLPLIFSLLLTACNTMSVASDDKTSLAAKEAGVEDKAVGQPDVSQNSTNASEIDEIKPEIKSISMDGDMLYNLLAAEFAGNAGDVDASLAYYREASKTIEDSRIAARTAYIALYGKHYDETLAALDRWRELEPDAKDLPRMYAVTYLKLEQPEKAVPHIEEMLSIYHESSADEAMAVKQLLAKEANTKDAYVVLQKLNEREEKNKHLLVLQSRYAAQLKHYDEALALLDQVLDIDPSLHEVLIIKSRILAAQGKHEEAILLIKQVVDELPDNNTLRLQYARMLVE